MCPLGGGSRTFQAAQQSIRVQISNRLNWRLSWCICSVQFFCLTVASPKLNFLGSFWKSLSSKHEVLSEYSKGASINHVTGGGCFWQKRHETVTRGGRVADFFKPTKSHFDIFEFWVLDFPNEFSCITRGFSKPDFLYCTRKLSWMLSWFSFWHWHIYCWDDIELM